MCRCYYFSCKVIRVRQQSIILANATHEFLKKNVSHPQLSDLIIKLEEKTFSRFDGLDKALLNLKVT